jgi:hypothetical protein
MANYTQTSAPLPWVEPYLQDLMGRSMEYANQPYQASPGQYVDPNQTLQSSWQAATNRAVSGSPVMGQATSQLGDWMKGTGLARTAAGTGGAGEGMNPYANQTNQFMGVNNPYLSDTIKNAQGDLAQSWNMVQKPQWDKAMSDSGSFGNSGVAQANAYGQNQLQQNMGRLGLDARMQAYNQSAGLMENQLNRQSAAGESQLNRQFQGGQNQAQRQDTVSNLERQMQMQALGMAPQFAQQDWNDINALRSVGQEQQGYLDKGAAQNYKWWEEAQRYPLDRLNAYGQALGVGGQGGVQTQQQPDPSTASTVLGGALTGASLWKLLTGG